MNYQAYYRLLLLAVGGVLTGCGAGDTTQNDADNLPIVTAGPGSPDIIDYSNLRYKTPTGRDLKQISESDLAHLIKNSVRINLQALNQGSYSGGSSSSFVSSSSPIWTSSSSSSFSSEFSSGAASSSTPSIDDDGPYATLNVRADGVDEPDIAKYDGENWFFVTSPNNYQFGEFNLAPTLQVADLNPTDANAEIIAAMELPGHWTDATDIYLLNALESTDTAAAVATHHSEGMTPNQLKHILARLNRPSSSGENFAVNGQTEIRVFDAEKPEAMELAHAITLDGNLIESRKIGDTLYLISSFTPWLNGLHNSYQNAPLANANEEKLAQAKLSELVPSIMINDEVTSIDQRCWVENGLQANHAIEQFVYITSIDLRQGELSGSTCYAGNAESTLFTTTSVYFTDAVTQNNQPTTAIHKFSVSPEVAYRGSGSVKGRLEHVENPEYLMDEHENDLRVVTTNGSFPVENYLSILEEDENTRSLNLVSQIPNSDRPEAIGKPGERVYSVRFEGEKAYVVTFRRTDPLYTIDLSDRTDPHVTGELTTPGYATYMHPVGENHLFYFGMNADNNGWELGLKAELIDVSGEDPVVVSSVLFGEAGSVSEAIGNYRAISIVSNDGSMKFAIPVELFQNYEWKETGIKLLEVTEIDGNTTLHNRGMLITATPEKIGQFYPIDGQLRAMIHGDTVFALHNDALWASFWNSPDEANGPIFADLDNLRDE